MALDFRCRKCGEAFKEVGAFMKRFKRRTRQDSVALVVDGQMYYL